MVGTGQPLVTIFRVEVGSGALILAIRAVNCSSGISVEIKHVMADSASSAAVSLNVLTIRVFDCHCCGTCSIVESIVV